MSRVSRTFIDCACYHIITRGNQKQTVFRRDRDCIKYLQMLKKAKKKYNILIYAYCLMPNHVHLLIETSSANNMSKFMHWVNRGYSAYFNYSYETSGHVWQGRFRSRPILKGRYLINCASYIENNPVRAGITNNIIDYKWSSYKENSLLSKNYMIDELKIDLRGHS